MSDIITSIKTCRTCLSKAKNMKSLFAVGIILGKVLSLKSVLTTCANLQISPADGLPQYICFPCIREIEKAYSFRIMCEKNQNILLNELKRDATLTRNFNDELTEAPESDVKPFHQSNNDLSYNCDINMPSEQNMQINRDDTIASIEELNVMSEQDNDIATISIANLSQTNSMPTNSDYKTNLNLNTTRKYTRFPCRLCRISYKTRKQLIQHQKYKHKGDYQDNLICSICDKRCQTSDAYKRHMNFHRTGKEYHCDTCGRDFVEQRTYMSHIYSHTGERPFLCNECGKTFKQSVDLRLHMRIHLNLYPYKCPTCDKKFRHSNSLIVHKRIHTGEKPYICGYCNKGFISRKSLRMHERLHTGVKPFVCRVCGKAFSRSNALKVHSLIHTGERPHVCPHCNSGFTQAHCLRTHMRKYHSNDDSSNSTQRSDEYAQDIEENTPIIEEHIIEMDNEIEYGGAY